jgi:hypothetical protein
MFDLKSKLAMNISKIDIVIKILHVAFSFFLYAFAALYFGHNGLNPSDPLEYIIPVFNDANVFPYLDRIILGVGLKLFANYIADPVILSYLFPIFLNFLIHCVSAYYILKMYDYKKLYIFVIFMLASPFNVATFSYVYPSTLMLLFLLIGANFISNKYNGIMAGVILAFSSLSKIQGISYAINIFFKFDLKYYIKSIFGFAIGLILIYIITSIIFNDYNYILKIIKIYFAGYASGQFDGYGGVMPPFEMYLFEPFVLFVILILYYNRDSLNEIERSIVSIAASQVILLILIYYVTRRGGALIPNYISPGIYLISLVAAMKLPSKYLYNLKYFLYYVLIYLVGIYYVRFVGGKQYFATSNHILELLSSFIIIAAFVLRGRLRIKDIWIFVGMVSLPIFAYKAQSENLSRVKWSEPFTIVYENSQLKQGFINYKFIGQNSYERRFKMIGDLDSGRKFRNCLNECEYSKNLIADSEIEVFNYFESKIKPINFSLNPHPLEGSTDEIAEHSSILNVVFLKDSSVVSLIPNLADHNGGLIVRIKFISKFNSVNSQFMYKLIKDSSRFEVEIPAKTERISIDFIKLRNVDIYGDLFVIFNE